MIDMTAKRWLRHSRSIRKSPFVSSLKGVAGSGAVVALCAGLGACSAQNGKPTVAAAPAPEPAVATAPTPQQAGPTLAALSAPTPARLAAAASAARERATVGVGLASFYGTRFHGRRTANGETFDMASLSAAHPSLPLPSYVRVTNVANGRSIVVRVNDRGPFHKGRLLDVSQRTADLLGFRRAGVANVKVDYVGRAADQRDDAKLVATYQEFGRPAAPEGVQVAGFRPVSDAEIANGATGTGVMLASLTSTGMRPTPSPQPASTVAAYAPQLTAAPLTLGGTLSAERLISAAHTRPAPSTAQFAAAPAKRIVRPTEPVLASATPSIEAVVSVAEPAAPSIETTTAKPNPVVAARIAASFEGFDSPPLRPAQDYGAAAAFTNLR